MSQSVSIHNWHRRKKALERVSFAIHLVMSKKQSERRKNYSPESIAPEHEIKHFTKLHLSIQFTALTTTFRVNIFQQLHPFAANVRGNIKRKERLINGFLVHGVTSRCFLFFFSMTVWLLFVKHAIINIILMDKHLFGGNYGIKNSFINVKKHNI